MDKPPHAAGRTAGRVTGDGWQVTGLRRASTWQAGFGKTGSIEHSTFNIQHRIEGEPASAARRQATGGWWRIPEVFPPGTSQSEDISLAPRV